MKDTTRLVELFQEFCESNGYTLLQDTQEGLKEKGYIKDTNFEDRFLIIFNDKALTKYGLVTKATKYKSGIDAITAKFSVQKEGDFWNIKSMTNFGIS